MANTTQKATLTTPREKGFGNKNNFKQSHSDISHVAYAYFSILPVMPVLMPVAKFLIYAYAYFPILRTTHNTTQKSTHNMHNAYAHIPDWDRNACYLILAT